IQSTPFSVRVRTCSSNGLSSLTWGFYRPALRGGQPPPGRPGRWRFTCAPMSSVIPDGRLVHAMQLPVQSQPSVAREPWEATAGPDEIGAIARQAAETGLASLAVCDHVVVDKRPPSDRMGPGWYDTIATL